MKTPEEIAIWCDMMLNHHPNIEDINFFNSIKDYMKEERPRSVWKGNNYDEHVCPRCGHYALYEEEYDGYYEVQSNYCPNCGAKMKRSVEE